MLTAPTLSRVSHALIRSKSISSASVCRKGWCRSSSAPGGAGRVERGGGKRGAKKPGTPTVAPKAALQALNTSRACSPGNHGETVMPDDTLSQNALSRSTRRPGGFPAMSAALIAPIEMPATQSGESAASCIASATPA